LLIWLVLWAAFGAPCKKLIHSFPFKKSRAFKINRKPDGSRMILGSGALAMDLGTQTMDSALSRFHSESHNSEQKVAER